MTAIMSRDHAADRADVLAAANLNGLRLALVALDASPTPAFADLELRFWNGLHLAALLAEIAASPVPAVRTAQIFRIRGGLRIAAGSLPGQVHAVSVSAIDAQRLTLRVEPVGDYSTYTLDLVWDASRIDPFFATLGFKFRPGCFTNDCAPQLPGKPLAPGPQIDYLARDYESFRHLLMTSMAQRVPGWQSTSEADFDQVLIDLFAAVGDELADYQDRVMGEAYLATTRSRISLARHARLVDYHLHQGQQASTWLALEIQPGTTPFRLDSQQLVTWTGAATPLPESVYFATREHWRDAAGRVTFDPLVNQLHLHTWRRAQPALRAGSTSADLVPAQPGAGLAEATALRDAVHSGALRRLLVSERLNPRTGRVPGRDPARRQLLDLIAGATGPQAAQLINDPVTGTDIVRLHWRDEDALQRDYSFTTFCDGAAVDNVSVFHGNLVLVHAGAPLEVNFHDEAAVLPAETASVKQRHYQRRATRGAQDGSAIATLPHEYGPLAYLPTPAGGEQPAQSTLVVEVTPPSSASELWDEVASLVFSDDSGENGDHFVVETDERQRSRLRFGNGTNGRRLPPGATVRARCQVGAGSEGNIGADQLVFAGGLTGPLSAAVARVWNPFDVIDGRDPEEVDRIRRNAPEAFRARQLRAVTLADYVRRAEEVDGVARAAARYAWTGSWRTVRLTIDPRGSTEFDADLRERVAAHLEAVRLIGEDIELRGPRFVPLDITVVLCARTDVWREDLRFVLEQEFSDLYTADGRRGFFHPDEWTFGQALHASRIEGRLQAVPGVEHVVSITMKRFHAPTPGRPGIARIEMAADEVVLLANDPDALERGLIRFDIRGGRG